MVLVQGICCYLRDVKATAAQSPGGRSPFRGGASFENDDFESS
jgi:hypothetical protein